MLIGHLCWAAVVLGGAPDLGNSGYAIPTELDAGPEPAGLAVPTPHQDFTPPPRSTGGQTWLVMLYQDADNKMLEEDIYLDLNEAERTGSSDGCISCLRLTASGEDIQVKATGPAPNAFM